MIKKYNEKFQTKLRNYKLKDRRKQVFKAENETKTDFFSEYVSHISF